MTRIAISTAGSEDIAALNALIAASVRALGRADYTPAQIEAALAGVFGVDTQLVADGTYFIARAGDDAAIAGCGGWSKRRTLYGGDRWSQRDDDLLDPARDAAKIRAFFVHPGWVRCGVGSTMLARCETEASAAGFARFEMGATLTGVPFYLARGYRIVREISLTLDGGEVLPVVQMEKSRLARVQRPDPSARRLDSD